MNLRLPPLAITVRPLKDASEFIIRSDIVTSFRHGGRLPRAKPFAIENWWIYFLI